MTIINYEFLQWSVMPKNKCHFINYWRATNQSIILLINIKILYQALTEKIMEIADSILQEEIFQKKKQT